MSGNKNITIEQFERYEETKAYWQPIIRAAGLSPIGRSAFGVFMLAGAIMRDEVVAQRKAELPHTDGLPIQPDNATEMVLRAMTDEERTELRERLGA